MIKSRIAKIAGLTIGMTLALGSTAGAVTIAELQAQINALMAQLATLQGTTVSTGTAITSNLTIGSTGSQVVTLQSALVAQGHLVMPVGVSMGYFGSLTKAAVAKWQAANGVAPAVGYFGPLSRAKFNATVSVGATGTVPGATVGSGTTVVVGSIATPGVEGSITVSVNPSPATGTKLYENEKMKQVMGIKLEAKTSDIRIERIKVDLDNVTSGNADNEVYRKIANKIYVMDGSTVLGSMALNTSTVVEDGANRFITIAGMNFVVPKDSTKVLYLALDANSTWDSAYDNDSWTLGIPVDGVRGIDGANINQYGPSTAFTREFTSAADLVDSATMAVSLNTDTPKTQAVICKASSTTDECDELEVARFNFKSTKDTVKVTDFVLDLVRGGTTSTATSTTAYIYDGSTLVGSASVAGTALETMTATFSDIDWLVPADTTRVLSVKLDIRDAGLLNTTFVASTDAADVTSENSAGTAITETGSADGKTFNIRKVGPEITLVSKSISTDGVPQAQGVTTNVSTSTLTATFNVKIKAVGGDLTLGTVASTVPLMASTTSNSLTGGSFLVYRNGAADTVVSGTATSTSYAIPSTCTSVGTNSCTLADGSEVTIPVTFQLTGRAVTSTTLSSGLYAIQFGGIQWWNDTTGSVQTTDFMSSEVDWRTADVSFP